MRFYPAHLLAMLLALASLAGCEGDSEDGVQLKPGSTTSALALPL